MPDAWHWKVADNMSGAVEPSSEKPVLAVAVMVAPNMGLPVTRAFNTHGDAPQLMGTHCADGSWKVPDDWHATV
jgi:hypothetical protein